MIREQSEWEKLLICQMGEIAQKLGDERAATHGLYSATSDDLESFVGRAPHPDLMRAFIRLHDLLSSFDQRSLGACISCTAFIRSARFLDSLKTSAHIIAYVNVAPDERPKKVGPIQFCLAILLYLWVLLELGTKGYCGWERVRLCNYIPSGK